MGINWSWGLGIELGDTTKNWIWRSELKLTCIVLEDILARQCTVHKIEVQEEKKESKNMIESEDWIVFFLEGGGGCLLGEWGTESVHTYCHIKNLILGSENCIYYPICLI